MISLFSRYLKEKINLNKIAKADNEMLEQAARQKKPLAIGEEMHKNLFAPHTRTHIHTQVHTCKLPTVNSLADILQKF